METETAPGERPAPEGLFAAVDLGSRSFHLIVARVHGENIEVVDRVQESVRLAAGLRDHRLDPAFRERALTALKRMGERLRDLPDGRVRAVGTNTFRKLQDPAAVKAFAKALGHRIEVIPGKEEARLIYLGVAGSLPESADRRLVVDIGGGSTELVIGERLEAQRATTLYMGCVSFTRRYFRGGALTRRAFDEAETKARWQLLRVKDDFRQDGWSAAFGSSGTIRAAAELLRSEGGITQPALEWLRDRMIAAGSIEGALKGATAIRGFPADRAPDFPGGVAILRAVMRALRLDELRPADAALREGVLADLIGRRRKQDVREGTIERLKTQYRVDREQAERVTRTALTGLRQLAPAWGLEAERNKRFLRWSAALHEIGLSLAFAGHHRHGAYIVRHSEMPGFSRDDQELLAALIESHRQRLRPERFENLAAADSTAAARLAAILRIAVLLCRRRSREPLPRIGARARNGTLELAFPEGWLEHHPLTAAGITEESRELAAAGIELRVAAAAAE